MAANRILNVILTALGWLIVPVQIITTFVLGILVYISFGLLLFPLSFIWMILFFPLLGASWLCDKVTTLRNIIGLLGIPLAVAAHTYACLVPSMGELESRATKLMLTESWPFTWEFLQFQTGRLEMASINEGPLGDVLDRISGQDPLKRRVLDRLSRREEPDPQM